MVLRTCFYHAIQAPRLPAAVIDAAAVTTPNTASTARNASAAAAIAVIFVVAVNAYIKSMIPVQSCKYPKQRHNGCLF